MMHMITESYHFYNMAYEMVGPDALAVVRPSRVYLLDFFCFGIQFYLLLSPHL